MKNRPKLTEKTDLSQFNNYYWLKTELIDFCREQGLSVTGSKQELEKRVEIFISSGVKTKSLPSKILGDRDSKRPITLDTPVVNYKNDLATRQFFVEQVGQSFRFDAYLRQFTNKSNVTKGLTYGDLVKGWLAEESKRNAPHYKSKIGGQFEYNRFIRDFFIHEKDKSFTDAIQAWKLVKATSGENTYACFKTLLKVRS